MKFISLTENHLFSKAYRSPQKALTRTVAVYVMKDRLEKKLKKENPLKESLNRVGISASKKVGGAVERNRAKRVVREAYRRTELECGIKKGYSRKRKSHCRKNAAGDEGFALRTCPPRYAVLR